MENRFDINKLSAPFISELLYSALLFSFFPQTGHGIGIAAFDK
jgi:hypothetical protein